MAELTPTSSPFMLTSAPPELPGLIAASVWMASSTVFWFCASPPAATGRFSALMMPVVTVPSSPSGEPIATTSWPTRRFAEEPNVTGVSPDDALGPHHGDVAARIGADDGERRDRCHRRRSPWSVRARLPGPPGMSGPPLDADTTWLLVRIRPSEDRMIPEPSSDARPMSTSSLTTLGTTLAATCSTEPTGTLAAGTQGAAPPMLDVPAGRSLCDSSRHSTADAGRDDRDRQCASGQSACARTLLGSHGRRAGRGLRGARGTGRRVRGTAAESAASHSASRTALLVRARPLRSGVSGAPCS